MIEKLPMFATFVMLGALLVFIGYCIVELAK
jgi:hypothetical protein